MESGIVADLGGVMCHTRRKVSPGSRVQSSGTSILLNAELKDSPSVGDVVVHVPAPSSYTPTHSRGRFEYRFDCVPQQICLSSL